MKPSRAAFSEHASDSEMLTNRIPSLTASVRERLRVVTKASAKGRVVFLCSCGLAASALMCSRIAPLLHEVFYSHGGLPTGGAHPGALLLFALPFLPLFAMIAPHGQHLLAPDFRSRLDKVFAMGLTIEEWKARPVRRRPGSRHVVAYRLVLGHESTGKQSSLDLIGKRDTAHGAGKAAKEYVAMQLLWDAGFGQDDRLKIPRPLHHFPDLQMILQEKARGVRFRSYLGQDSDSSLGHARMAGLWLAKLHNLSVSPPCTCSPEAEIASLHMFVAALSRDCPQLAGELQACAVTAEQNFLRLPEIRATFVHGDFHPDHIFVSKDLVTVIDFERFCIGDPARDLGSFIAHMRITARFSGKSLAAVNHEIAAFLKGYFSAVSVAQAASIVSRLSVYEMHSCIEALYYVASVLRVSDPARIAMYMKCVQESGAPVIEEDHPSPIARAATA
jgi:thiamine kinase-like enzyme